MVTSTLLRRYTLFSFLKQDQLRTLISISVEETYKSGIFLFREGDLAEWLYILAKGGVDLLFTIEIPSYPAQTRELYFGNIQPGEMFGISALIEPHIFMSSARTNKPSKVVKIHSRELLTLCNQDAKLGFALYNQIAKAVMARLSATRLKLATTRVVEL